LRTVGSPSMPLTRSQRRRNESPSPTP
jgi:hypothetical protein